MPKHTTWRVNRNQFVDNLLNLISQHIIAHLSVWSTLGISNHTQEIFFYQLLSCSKTNVGPVTASSDFDHWELPNLTQRHLEASKQGGLKTHPIWSSHAILLCHSRLLYLWVNLLLLWMPSHIPKNHTPIFLILEILQTYHSNVLRICLMIWVYIHLIFMNQFADSFDTYLYSKNQPHTCPYS